MSRLQNLCIPCKWGNPPNYSCPHLESKYLCVCVSPEFGFSQWVSQTPSATTLICCHKHCVSLRDHLLVNMTQLWKNSLITVLSSTQNMIKRKIWPIPKPNPQAETAGDHHRLYWNEILYMEKAWLSCDCRALTRLRWDQDAFLLRLTVVVAAASKVHCSKLITYVFCFFGLKTPWNICMCDI